MNLWKSTQLVKPVEGNVLLALRNRAVNKEVTVDCFVYRELEKWQDVSTDDSALVQLVLLNWQNPKPASTREKSIRQIKGYEYQIEAEIVEIAPRPDYNDLLIILDCGIYMEATAGKDLRLKVGDYISAEGRLDAHIVGKVN
ncbi:hypothetical protein HYU40_00260 [Candidatus Woesearchaeota archaeon]|nr:hypothetical protein [Candidatus Woesearchaeota archaeon]